MKVYLIGVGMGNAATLTMGARDAIAQSQLLVGAQRMLDAVRGACPCGADVRTVAAVRPDDIVSALAGSQAEVASVLFSGDVGFYSGAPLLYERLGEQDVEVLPGISSLSYLCAKARVPWQDAKVVSVHGRSGDPAGEVQAHAKVFVLTGGTTKAQDVCAQLVERGLGDVRVFAGERLSYEDERVVEGSARELAGLSFADLTVLLVLNDGPIRRDASAPCLDDGAFLRDKVPMTKEEVRELAVCKLRLQPGHVLWDVGAGTGSVSVEGALAVPRGQVFAIERDEAALRLLEANKRRFGLANLHIVPGTAPAALEGLPAPDRVFVGGSAGRLKDILACALAANPRVRVVVTAIALETVAEVMPCMAELGMTGIEAVQVATSKARKLGSYHLMTAANPVYIFSANGLEGKDEDAQEGSLS